MEKGNGPIMLDWLAANAELVNIALNGLMLVIWLAYLQLFYASYRRANRAVVHIGMAAENGSDARCLVTNMGSDTVYILGVKVDLTCGGETLSALVTDRIEQDAPQGANGYRDVTSQGPLAGGEPRDIGSFRDILRRVGLQHGQEPDLDACSEMEITVVVAAQQAHRLMGGYKRYGITHENGRLRFRPTEILTRQITSRRKRRALNRLILDQAF